MQPSPRIVRKRRKSHKVGWFIGGLVMLGLIIGGIWGANFFLQRANYEIPPLEEVTVRLSAGQTLAELKSEIASYGFTEAEIEAAMAQPYHAPLLADKPADANLEGYIFPDTYRITREQGVEGLLEASFDNLYDKLQNDGSLVKIQQGSLSLYEVLTLASMVQKEVSLPEDQRMVAGVFLNRLGMGLVLGSDVTFHYAYKQGYCVENTPACASSYNTRVVQGLPPGPISNMEYSAIQAVLHPAAHDYLYFVAGDDGTTYYASTDDEHSQNVANYCTTLCN